MSTGKQLQILRVLHSFETLVTIYTRYTMSTSKQLHILKVLHSSEISVTIYHLTQCNINDDLHLHQHFVKTTNHTCSCHSVSSEANVQSTPLISL